MLMFLLGLVTGALVMMPAFYLLYRQAIGSEREAQRWCEEACNETARFLHYLKTGEFTNLDGSVWEPPSEKPTAKGPEPAGGFQFFEPK